MTDELAIACTLGATDFAARSALMGGLGADALIDARRDGTRAVLRFRALAGVRERVDAFVAAESGCCAFLTLRVTGAPGEIVLTIDAPADAEAVLADMVSAFGVGSPA
jgi:hypothetical protein